MYTFEYVKDENGKVTDILVNGKPVKRGSMRGFRKAQNSYFFVLYEIGNIPSPSYSVNSTRGIEIYDNSDTGEKEIWGINPYSGVQSELTPLEATIYVWCFQWYKLYVNGEHDAPIQAYDDMKYFLHELNSEAYMDLID